MASAKPRGRWDDLDKMFRAAVKKGDKGLADRIKREKDAEAQRLANSNKAFKELEKTWNRRLAAYDYTAAETAKGSKGAQTRAKSKLRGMDKNFRSVAAKENADMKGTMAKNLSKAEAKDAAKKAGGRNSKAAQAKRARQRANSRDAARRRLG
jgi:hypothetical protein